MLYGNGYDPDKASENCVVHLDTKSVPRVLWCGEDLKEYKLPIGTRVIYAKPPIPGLLDRQAAIRRAIENPENMEPLSALLRSGMKLTIAIDDISLPLPMMALPDIRQTVLEIVLDLASSKGVTDIHIILATSFHRRLTPGEMKRCVGAKIFREFYPVRYYNHDGENPDGMVDLGNTAQGERVRINRRAAESDLLVYANINLVPMDGGHKSVGVGLCDYPALQAHHTPQAIAASDSYMDPGKSELTHSCGRVGRIIEKHLKIFHIETALNNRMFDNVAAFLGRNEDTYSAFDRTKLKAAQFALSQMSTKMKRKAYFSIPAPYEMIGVHAGETDATHAKILQYCYDQYCIPVEGQSDVVITGITFVSPYNVNSIMNPLLVRVMALGYFFNFYRNMPVVKKNGVMIVTHPCYDEFDPVFHPSYIEFFNRKGSRLYQDVPRRQCLPRRASILYVVLGGKRPATHRQNHRRWRGQPASAGDARVGRGEEYGRSPRYGRVVCGSQTHGHVTALSANPDDGCHGPAGDDSGTPGWERDGSRMRDRRAP